MGDVCSHITIFHPSLGAASCLHGTGPTWLKNSIMSSTCVVRQQRKVVRMFKKLIRLWAACVCGEWLLGSPLVRVTRHCFNGCCLSALCFCDGMCERTERNAGEMMISDISFRSPTLFVLAGPGKGKRGKTGTRSKSFLTRVLRHSKNGKPTIISFQLLLCLLPSFFFLLEKILFKILSKRLTKKIFYFIWKKGSTTFSGAGVSIVWGLNEC